MIMEIILYSSDKLTITTDKDSIATIKKILIAQLYPSDELLTEAGYVFTLLGSDYTLYVQSDTVSAQSGNRGDLANRSAGYIGNLLYVHLVFCHLLTLYNKTDY